MPFSLFYSPKTFLRERKELIPFSNLRAFHNHKYLLGGGNTKRKDVKVYPKFNALTGIQNLNPA